MTMVNRKHSRAPRCHCEGFFYIVNGIFLGSFIIYLAKTQRLFDVTFSSPTTVSKCPSPTVRGANSAVSSPAASAKALLDPYDYAHNTSSPFIETCLDPEGPVPVILMSLGRSGTDSTWQILKELTGTTMKAVEIVGGFEAQTIDFFHSLEGLPTPADAWPLDETYDWRKEGGGTKVTYGFYHHIKDFCANGNCMDGKWIFKWFCDEQRRYRDVGGLVGFKWKAFMSAFRTQPAYSALKLIAQLGLSDTPIRVIRSRRNPFDVYLSKLKHSLKDNLPDHCQADDEECIKKHASIRLAVPADDMYEWLLKTYEEENEIDALLSELGIRTVHVEYDQLYYASSDDEALKEWNKIFKFLGKRHDWAWSDITGAAGLKPTTKSRSHKALIENFDEVHDRLKGTKLEQFVRVD